MTLRPPLCLLSARARSRALRRSSLCAWLLLAACSSEHGKPPPPPTPPPPLPTPAAAVPAPSAPAAEPAATPREHVAAPEAPAARSGHKETKAHAGKASAKKGAKSSAPAAAKPSPAPAPAKPAAASGTAKVEAPKPKPGKVSVPSTAHVHLVVPSALQADLDRDPRMQPWINQVVAVIDRCYGQAASGGALTGTIEVAVTMHQNERPDADIKTLPPVLSPIVACATGGLMRSKMPFFTGSEGARSLVRMQFK